MKFYPGETVSLKGTFRNVDGQIVEPSSTAVTICNPAGTSVEDGVPDRVEEGVYRYNYDLPSDAMAGDWFCVFKGIVSGLKVKDIEFFKVVSLP